MGTPLSGFITLQVAFDIVLPFLLSTLAVRNLVARHGIEPCPLAFQTSTLPSSSRAKLGGRCETRTRISRLQAVGNPLIRTAQLGRDERIELS